jgi:transcription-repair coupling factor (superfamily II helicase)
MRDLEIRGAGNLLGAEQSGHIAAVGFELYCRLLKQSVSNLKGEKTKPRIEVQLRLDFLVHSREAAAPRPELPELPPAKSSLSIEVPREVAVWHEESEPAPSQSAIRNPQSAIAAATLPASYIPEARHRIDLYRKLAQAADTGALRDLKNELRDRFGPLPPAAQLLLKTAELKLIAVERNVTAIETKGDKLMLTRNNDYLMASGKFPRLTKATPSARLNEIKRLLLSL